MRIVRNLLTVCFLVVLVTGLAFASHPDVIEKVKPSVVKVSKSVWERDPFSGEHRYDWGGSGVIVAKDRGRAYILTNRHVADETWYEEERRWCEVDRMEVDCMPEFVREQTLVTFADGRNVRAVLHWRSPCADLAVLEVAYTGSTVKPAELESGVKVGEEVFALGHPLGLEYTLTKGIVSAERRFPERGCVYQAIQTDASINPGNSGGGLFNSEGQLVGINTWKITAGEGMGFAVSIAHYLREIGQDPSRFTHDHEAPPVEHTVASSGRRAEETQQRVYLWIGKFSVTVELANGEKRTAEVSDALGLYTEEDFKIARRMEIESRKEVIKQFLLRRYTRDIARVASVDFLNVERKEFKAE